MFRSKIFWGFVLGVVTSVLIFEGRINLGYNPLWSRVSEVLTLPGTRFADAVFSSSILNEFFGRFRNTLSIACNLMVYTLFWSGCIAMGSYFRQRRHPYDRQTTLLPPSL